VESSRWQHCDAIDSTVDRQGGERNLNGLNFIMPNLLAENTIVLLDEIEQYSNRFGSIWTAIAKGLYLR
jgi:hypothetical protein